MNALKSLKKKVNYSGKFEYRAVIRSELSKRRLLKKKIFLQNKLYTLGNLSQTLNLWLNARDSFCIIGTYNFISQVTHDNLIFELRRDGVQFLIARNVDFPQNFVDLELAQFANTFSLEAKKFLILNFNNFNHYVTWLLAFTNNDSDKLYFFQPCLIKDLSTFMLVSSTVELNILTQIYASFIQQKKILLERNENDLKAVTLTAIPALNAIAILIASIGHGLFLPGADVVVNPIVTRALLPFNFFKI